MNEGRSFLFCGQYYPHLVSLFKSKKNYFICINKVHNKILSRLKKK